MKLLKQFIQQETVLTAAAVLAVISAFFVPPDVQYLGYIDLRTLAILFSLMTVMAGLRRQGFFDGLGRALLSRTHSTFQLTLVLVGLCFFGSMFITNDVSLLTFVPFTFVVLSRLGADVRRSLLVPVVCMQTIAANLGSMLTPIGNPQNLYLYGKSGMSIGGFVLLMLPYTLVSLLLLLAWAALVCRKASAALSVDELVSSSASQGDQKIILLYLVLFAVCLLSVIRVLPYGIAFAAVLVCVLFADPHTLRAVDYSLLLTFVAFFIFIGNLGRIPAFSGWLQEFLTGREVLVAVLASQVTSNVPAALLLSGFTAETQALIIGTNLGGLGTLIASMASLISYRQIARELPQGKKQYFGLFTLSNLIFLAILLGVWFFAPLSVADDLWIFYTLFVPAVAVGSAGGKGVLPHKILSHRLLRSWCSPDGTKRGSGRTAPAPSSASTSQMASRHISLSVSKSDLHDLHFHPVVPDPCKKPEKAADRRIFQIVVPQHIAPAGHLQTAVPWGKLAFRIRNREICSHILDFRRPEPRFGDHLHRRTVGSIKDQHAAGEGICHCLYQRLDLLGQKINRTRRRQRTPPRRRHRSCQTMRGLSGRRGCFVPAPRRAAAAAAGQ